MMNKASLHIPINTPEQRVIRDAVAKVLAVRFDAVILNFVERVVDIDGEPLLYPISRVDVYVDVMTDDRIKFFQNLVGVIARVVGDSVMLEVKTETVYIGTATMEE